MASQSNEGSGNEKQLDGGDAVHESLLGHLPTQNHQLRHTMQYKPGTETGTDIREGPMSHMSEHVAENNVKENDIAHDSGSDSHGNSSNDEKRLKKLKGKQLLSTGLATVATIHATHSIYEARERRDARLG
jgi:hypothetical protein